MASNGWIDLAKAANNTPAQMSLTPAEQRLIWRLRQLSNEQCQGVMVKFEPGGFGLFKLDKQEKMSS